MLTSKEAHDLSYLTGSPLRVLRARAHDSVLRDLTAGAEQILPLSPFSVGRPGTSYGSPTILQTGQDPRGGGRYLGPSLTTAPASSDC
jgi:hypothetical protein